MGDSRMDSILLVQQNVYDALSAAWSSRIETMRMRRSPQHRLLVPDAVLPVHSYCPDPHRPSVLLTGITRKCELKHLRETSGTAIIYKNPTLLLIWIGWLMSLQSDRLNERLIEMEGSSK
eukprot:scaffold13744_cov88-Skeletonema_dohrnii-CCMP3373.AAC.3